MRLSATGAAAFSHYRRTRQAMSAPWVADDPTYSASSTRVLAEDKSVSWFEPVKLELGSQITMQLAR
jgi:hypothetical protein